MAIFRTLFGSRVTRLGARRSAGVLSRRHLDNVSTVLLVVVIGYSRCVRGERGERPRQGIQWLPTSTWCGGLLRVRLLPPDHLIEPLRPHRDYWQPCPDAARRRQGATRWRLAVRLAVFYWAWWISDPVRRISSRGSAGAHDQAVRHRRHPDPQPGQPARVAIFAGRRSACALRGPASKSSEEQLLGRGTATRSGSRSCVGHALVAIFFVSGATPPRSYGHAVARGSIEPTRAL